MIQNYWLNALYSLVPTIVIGIIFWMVLRSIFRADRTERRIYAEIEAEEREKMGLPPKPAAPSIPVS